MQSTWFGDKALPGTFYGKCENGMCFVLILYKTKSNKLSFVKNILKIRSFHETSTSWVM